jgi:hypothetical protein
MNLEAILHWAEMVLWQLSTPRSKGRQGIEAKRINRKLGSGFELHGRLRSQ